MSQRTSEGVEVSPEVLAFAREQQVEAYLPAVIDLVRRFFPGDELSVELEEDPEVEDLNHIVLTMQGVQVRVEELLAAKDEYHRALYRVVPGPLICTFRVKPRLAR